MHVFDNHDMSDKIQDALNDPSPEQKDRIEQIARDKGITLEEARDYLFKNQDKGQDEPQV